MEGGDHGARYWMSWDEEGGSENWNEGNGDGMMR